MIKRLDKDCADLIISLHGDFKDGFNKNVLTSSFNNPNFSSFGYFDGNELVGEISFSSVLDQADIESVFVSEKCRKKGVASALVSFLLGYLKERGVAKIFLEVRQGNIPALALYEKFNFKTINIRERYYADGENAVIMSLGEKS